MSPWAIFRAFPLALVCLMSGWVIAPTEAAAPQLFWSDVSTGRIVRSDLDGSNVQTVVQGMVTLDPLPRGVNRLAMDESRGVLYWSDTYMNTVGHFDKNAQLLTVGLAVAASPTVASASQSFPGAIMEYLESTGDAPPCPPTCTLCHASPSGGVETVRSAGFTDNLRGQSSVAWNARNRMPPGALTALDPTTVGPALKALETLDCASAPGKVCDSDNDMVPDVAELRAGTNPDGPGALGECPQYGCGAKADTASIVPTRGRSRAG